MTREDLTNYFTYMDGLRQSGITNMFGAGAYLQKKFQIGEVLSIKVHALWMETFGKHESAYDRATEALNPSRESDK